MRAETAEDDALLRRLTVRKGFHEIERSATDAEMAWRA